MIACILMHMNIECTQDRSITQNEYMVCDAMDWHQHSLYTNEGMKIYNSDMPALEDNNNKTLNSLHISSDNTYIANNKTTVKQIPDEQYINNEEEKRKSLKEAESCISDSAEIWRQNKRIQSEKEKEYHKELKAAEENHRRLALQQKKLDNEKNEDICDIWKNISEKYAKINDLFT